MSTSVATYTERQKAVYFLRLIHASLTNVGLIAAVIAWMRVEGRHWNAKVFATRLIAGTKFVPVSYSNPMLREEQQAANEEAATKAKWVAAALRAARRGDAGAAGDFLLGLSMAKWDANFIAGSGGLSTTKIWKALSKIKSIANAQVKAPSKAAVAKAPAKPKSSGVNLLPSVAFLQPYASEAFYDARGHGLPSLPSPIYDALVH
jgi:hypothetical protein